MIRKQFKIIVFMALFGNLVSCDNDTSKGILFPQQIHLEGTELSVGGLFLKYPYRIRVNDQSMYVMDLHPSTFYCHEIAYPSMENKAKFAQRGQAPNEFLDAENIRFDKQKNLYILDANRKRISVFEPLQLKIPQKVIDLETSLIRTLDFDILNDSTFIVPDYMGSNRISLLDFQGKIKKKLFTIPTTVKEDGNMALAQAWRSFLSYNSKNGILALATQLGQVLEVYDIHHERLIKVIKEKEPEFFSNGDYAIPTGIMGYSDIYVGEKYIYAVFWGESFDDIKQQADIPQGGKYIHVFDLGGTPVKEYVLDRRITGFHVDEKNGKFLGLDVNSNNPIVEYNYLKEPII